MREAHGQRGAAVALVDPGRAHSGRTHVRLIGDGKDSYLPDLLLGAKLIRAAPRFRDGARAARMFLMRAVHDMARDGITQFLELGSGYPCPPDLHQVARTANPPARTLYIDSDPVVAAHLTALLADDQTSVIHADLTATATIGATIAAEIDTNVPTAACLSFVGEFLPDPRAVIDAVTATLAPGSRLILSHVTTEADTAVIERVTKIYRSKGIGFWPRSRAEIAALLSDYDLLDPGRGQHGLVPVHRWRPRPARKGLGVRAFGWGRTMPQGAFCLAGVGALR